MFLDDSFCSKYRTNIILSVFKDLTLRMYDMYAFILPVKERSKEGRTDAQTDRTCHLAQFRSRQLITPPAVAFIVFY